MFAALDSLPFELRYSTRFICLDQYDAEKEITSFVKGWNQRVLGFMDQFFNNPNAKVNRDALPHAQKMRRRPKPRYNPAMWERATCRPRSSLWTKM